MYCFGTIYIKSEGKCGLGILWREEAFFLGKEGKSMRRKKFLNRVLASALTAAMLVSSVPVTTLAAEKSGSSEAELFNEGTDSGEAVSLSSEAEDFSDEEIISEPEGNSDAQSAEKFSQRVPRSKQQAIKK